MPLSALHKAFEARCTLYGLKALLFWPRVTWFVCLKGLISPIRVCAGHCLAYVGLHVTHVLKLTITTERVTAF